MAKEQAHSAADEHQHNITADHGVVSCLRRRHYLTAVTDDNIKSQLCFIRFAACSFIAEISVNTIPFVNICTGFIIPEPVDAKVLQLFASSLPPTTRITVSSIMLSGSVYREVSEKPSPERAEPMSSSGEVESDKKARRYRLSLCSYRF